MDQVTIIITEPPAQLVTVTVEETAELVTINVIDPAALPPGGSTGDVLKKSSNTNFQVEWGPPAGGGVIGPNQVAFGAPVTGAIMSSSNLLWNNQFVRMTIGTPAYDTQYYGLSLDKGIAAQGESDFFAINDPTRFFYITVRQYGEASNFSNPLGNGAVEFATGGTNGFIFGNTNSKPMVFLSGPVATDIAFRVDTVGLRVGPLSSISAANNYPFEVDSLFRVNTPAGGYGVTLLNPPYGGHFLSIKFDTFNSIYQQYYGDTIFKSDSYTGGLGTLTLKQTGETEIRYNGNVKASFYADVVLYNNASFPLYWSHNGGINYLTFYDTNKPAVARGLMLTNSYTAISAPVGVTIFAFIGGNAKMSITDTDTYIANTTSLGKKLNLAASIAVASSLNIPVGLTPTTPIDGDIWYNGTNLKFRNGATTRNINTTDYVINEIPSGLINGINATFTTAFDFVPGTEEVYLNGLKLVKLEDYNTTGTNQIDLYVAPGIGEELSVNYTKN